MIRSQSIVDMAEKRKTGLFQSLRSRKLSRDLNAQISTNKPLSQSLATNKPVSKRHSVMMGFNPIDKENLEVYKLRGSKRSLLMIKQVSSPSPSSEKTLATMYSALELFDAVSVETLSLDLRSHKDVKLETDEFSPFVLKEFQQYLGDYVLEEKVSTPTKLHRTVNLHNMKEFIGKLEGLPVPMLNRKSLDFEANEIKQLQEKLSKEKDDVNIHLCENAMFMTFFQQGANESIDRSTRTWDEIDTAETFKLDKYNSDENIYMHM